MSLPLEIELAGEKKKKKSKVKWIQKCETAPYLQTNSNLTVIRLRRFVRSLRCNLKCSTVCSPGRFLHFIAGKKGVVGGGYEFKLGCGGR